MRGNLSLGNCQVGKQRGWLKLGVGLIGTAMSMLDKGEGICISAHGQGLRNYWQEIDSRRLSLTSVPCLSRGMISPGAKEADFIALSDSS